MRATVHIRVPGTHKSLCGLGYDWPSSITFATEPHDANCRECLRTYVARLNEEA